MKTACSYSAAGFPLQRLQLINSRNLREIRMGGSVISSSLILKRFSKGLLGRLRDGLRETLYSQHVNFLIFSTERR